ncbi:PepSY domain-containing protein [Altererythrobacter sp. GH1-8]|uniref:PepSY domain-containing protein n=1 Tax=Altererythrobacter sp. GH1-8 TaxID=3349333 RepID=UPI00374D70D9
MDRVFLTKLHLILAAFMFPAVLMFLVTGALYTWGNKGAWYEESATVALAQPLTEQPEGDIINLAVQQLVERDLPMPSGKLTVETGEGASLEWIGARSEITLSVGAEPRTAVVAVKEASFHRWLVQLHKAKGSDYFKVYATLLASVLFLLVASGIVMGLQVKALRRITIGSSIAGALAFIGAVLLG